MVIVILMIMMIVMVVVTNGGDDVCSVGGCSNCGDGCFSGG